MASRAPDTEHDPVAEAGLAAHVGLTEDVHGIPDTSVLVVVDQLDAAIADAVAPLALVTYVDQGVADLEALLADHAADGTGVHGIADTAALVLTGDARLANARPPTGAAGGVLAGNYPNPGFAVDMATQAELDASVAPLASSASVTAEAVTRSAADVTLTNAAAAHAALTVSVHGIPDTSKLMRLDAVQTVTAAKTYSADLTMDTTGTLEATPRQLLFSPVGAAEAWRVGAGQGGVTTAVEGFQGGRGKRAQVFTYWGLELRGGRQSTTPPALVTGATTDPGVSIINTQAGVVPAVVQAAASQSVNLFEWRNSSGSALAYVTNGGTLVSLATVSAQDSSSTQVQIGAKGPASQAAVKFGNTGTDYVYLSATGDLRTDSSFNTNRTSAQTSFGTRLLAADTQVAFRVAGDGKHEWGPGGSTAIDTNLYRQAVGILATDSEFKMSRTATSSTAFSTIAGAASTPNFLINADGKLNWGDGTAARDTNLYRVGVATLKTDSAFTVGGNLNVSTMNVNSTNGVVSVTRSSIGNAVVQGFVTGDTAARTALRTGDVAWGDGTNTVDVTLARPSAGAITVQGAAAATSTTLTVKMIASQSADAFQVIDSTNVAIMKVTSGGSVKSNFGVFGDPAGASTGALNVYPRATNSVGVIVKGLASQTANLQEWQNSAGSPVVSFAASGTLTTAGSVVLSNGSPAGGFGVLAIGNAGTLPSSNPVGGGVLYAEGGALKYRGSAGTITVVAAA